MSYRKEKHLSLAGFSQSKHSQDTLKEISTTVLKSKMHGICFSPYDQGQNPGDALSEAQIRRKLECIAPYTNWIRSFSCTEGNEQIPALAKSYGLKTLVGAWLSDDLEQNEKELNGLIQLCRDGHVDIAAVGNEVMYRKELSEQQLIEYIIRFKEAVPNIEVGYVDAYYEFSSRPKITEACDVILANCYPYWEACHIDYSLLYMKQMYHHAKDVGGGKKVIITETGWPSQGSSLGDAHPSYENALQYYINAQLWSKEDAIEMFYFSAFDEPWKVGAEGDVGAYWGLWDKGEQLKFNT